MRPQTLFLTLSVVIAIVVGSAFRHFIQDASKLRAENDTLREELQEPGRQSGANAELERIRLNAVVPTVRADSQEAERLRAELDELKRQGPLLTNLVGENELLRIQLHEAQQTLLSQRASAPEREGNTLTREQIEAYLCYGHLYQISIAAGLWAQTHDGYAPTNLVLLREYLAPMILICPSAKPKSVASRWEKFDPSTITYRMPLRARDPGIRWSPPLGGPGHGFASCPIHKIDAFNQTGIVGMPSKYIPMGAEY